MIKISLKGKMKEMFVISKKNNSTHFKMMFKDGGNELKVTIISSEDRYIFNKIEKQLNKFNTCMFCLACNSACPLGAINVSNQKYIINENKCINCLKCIDKFDSGCIISSALKIKKGS
jgi:phosphoadenosine phosphosulfate reductase